MLRFETAGESHGECLVATLTGLPAGVPVSLAAIDRELWRRQQGFGRGGRMKIETDHAQIVSGVRHSQTIGSPIAILIENKDWKNWTEALPVEDIDGGRRTEEAGHAAAARPCRPGRRASSTISTMPATFWSAPARARRRRGWRWARWPRRFSGSSASRCLSHVIAVGDARLERAAHLGRTGRAQPARRSAAGLRGSGSRAAHEGGGRSGLSNRRHRGRRLRSGGARRAAGPGLAHRLGFAAGRADWRRPSSRCRR